MDNENEIPISLGISDRIGELCGPSNYGPCLGICSDDFKRREYETDDNIFLYITRVDYPSLWDMCFEDGAVLLVPQGISLGSEVLLADVETHLIRDTKIPGEFFTTNGKKITIDGSDIYAKVDDGFLEERQVRIVGSEELEESNPDGEGNRTIKVIYISRPLEGGVPAPDDSDELDYDSMRKYVAILRSSPEIEGIFMEMDAFIAEVNFLGDSAPDGFAKINPSLEACVLGQWQMSVEALENSGFFEDMLGSSIKERHRLQLAQIVESYLLGGIYRTVYPWLQQKYAAKDIRLSQILHAMRYYTPADIGIAPQFHISVQEAVKDLMKLGDCRTPLEKLLVFKEAAMRLFRLVQRNLKVHFGGVGDFQLATDDLVQLLVYTIIRTYPHSSSLLLDLRYIKLFHFVSTSTTATGYYLNNFEVALDFLMSKLGLSLELGSARSRDVVERTDLTFEQQEESLAMIAPSMTDTALLSNVKFLLETRGIDISTLSIEGSNSIAVDDTRSTKTDSKKQRNKTSRTDKNGEVVMIFGDGNTRQNTDTAQSFKITLKDVAPNVNDTTNDKDESNNEKVAKILFIACGNQYYSAVTEEGALLTWGLAEGGRLGHGPDHDVFHPLANPYRVLALKDEIITSVSCGSHHMLALNDAGEIFSWGDNRCGQIGHGRGAQGTISIEYNPKRIDFFRGQSVKGIAAGNVHSLCLTDEGSVYSWGRAQSGRLGRIPEQHCDKDQYTPGKIDFNWSYMVPIASSFSCAPDDYNRIPSGSGIISSIAAGWGHSISITEDGRAFTWGLGVEGRLGHGSYSDEFFPKQVRALASPHIKIVNASGGYAHSLFLTSEGEVLTCGSNKYGQLGAPSSTRYLEVVSGAKSKNKIPVDLVPKVIPVLKPYHVQSISTGENHCAILTSANSVYTWGSNTNNQCAHSKAFEQIEEPREVDLLKGSLRISSGASHTIVVMD